ncbi:MAG: carotenoid 1,2-hydratase [Curvibacter sp.]|nr:carotenoid 1,2-hydratase [Curvibacter sp.]
MPHSAWRRRLLLGMLGGPACWPAFATTGQALRFPRDFGSHPDQRIEWWYVTGALRSGSRRFGFQVTFFRSRVEGAQGLKSAFAARQLIFAHAALTDVQGQRLWRAQRVAREGFGWAQASESDTGIRLGDWRLTRIDGKPSGPYDAELQADDFGLQLRFTPRQSLLLHGPDGISQKGPDARQSSHYYSEPQLQVTGHLRLKQEHFELDRTDHEGWNRAWLDHEWSQELMAPQAVGWDWLGINLLDGGALMAFRMRRPDGSTLWSACTWRSSEGKTLTASNGQIRWTPLRHWESPQSQARYPVEWALSCLAGEFRVRALVDAQELDSRQSTGAIYWEGLCELLDTAQQLVGRGYLEMTGYAEAIHL